MMLGFECHNTTQVLEQTSYVDLVDMRTLRRGQTGDDPDKRATSHL